MDFKVLLTADLSFINDLNQTQVFDIELSKREWKKIHDNSHIWKATIQFNYSEEFIINKAKKDVELAAGIAGISNYRAEIYLNGGYSVVL